MSNIIERKYPLDMNPKEVEALDKFINDGLPGIIALTPEKAKAAVELYLNGASYQEISVKLSLKKVMITYIAYKNNFYEAKMEMYENMVNAVKHKMDLATIRGTDFIVDLMSSIESYYREILLKYSLSKDKRIIESADFENIKLYMKCMETIQKIQNPDTNSKLPIGLNFPKGATFKKIDDNTVEVSPNDHISNATNNKLSEVLKTLAELRELKDSEGNKEKK